MIRAIIFDCFGVLTGDIWKEFVLGLPEEQQEPARELNRAHDRMAISLQEFSQAIYELTGHEPQVIESLISSDMVKNTNLLEYIAHLKKDYKIGLLSNVGSNWIRESFLSQQEQQLFDDFVLSYEVRLIKPDREIYKLAASRLKVSPSECIFIDDGLQNCEGAKSTGMGAVLYKDFRQFTSDLEALLTDPLADTNNNS